MTTTDHHAETVRRWRRMLSRLRKMQANGETTERGDRQIQQLERLLTVYEERSE